MVRKALITGSAGLIGSASVAFFCEKGFDVYGIDNDMRSYFFGKEASTKWNGRRLTRTFENYYHIAADIRDQRRVTQLFTSNKFDIVIHTAAQPSHDWAAREPLTDFSINASATLLLLENFRKYASNGVFIFTSTNKVYGDLPNKLPFLEKKMRFELPKLHPFYNGINESMSIDQSTHSVFGASKVAADVMVQEYGRYFQLATGVFRGGCLTGAAHSGSTLHGFLAYLVKCILKGETYTIYGYKGKQVRDNIHAYDLVSAFYSFYNKPRMGEVYNIGGSRHSNISILEAIKKIEEFTGKKAKIKYSRQARNGDHIWYISDVSKFKKHYPKWKYTYTIEDILQDLVKGSSIT